MEYRLTFISDGRIIENLRPSTLVGAAFATTLSFGLIAIRLRNRRRSEVGWHYRPGTVACVAAMFAGLIKFAALMIWGVSRHFRFESWYVPSILGQLIEPAAMGVVGAWLALGLAGLWKRERTLVDDMGIAIGLLWLGLEVFCWVALCFE